MSFPNFDPSQGQPAPFTENGNAGLPQGQQPIQGMQQAMPMQQTPQGSEGQPPFQGQAGLEQPQTGAAGAPDSKTTLWYVVPPPQCWKEGDTQASDTLPYRS